MKQEFITKAGASYHKGFLLSFESEKAFIDSQADKILLDIDLKDRKQILKDIYRAAKAEQKNTDVEPKQD